MHYLAKIFSLLGCILLIISVFVIFIAIIFRYFIGIALPWPEELTRFLYLWFTFCGVVVAEYKNYHLKVDAIFSYSGNKIKNIISILSLCITFIFYIIAAYWGYDMTLFNYEMENRAVSMDLHLVWIWAALPICLSAAALMAAYNLVRTVFSKKI
ncbi:TRAP transporter small permease subunit [uncultured Mailhella sp.]|uniref:TRAP transporter small permease n=1 Tax=uncultured Mailhella sp. TaxID=1981031 RepID=UPI0025F69BD2|nr:TRAP transporter small permease subunit [uncultured Mailhella sp.]